MLSDLPSCSSACLFCPAPAPVHWVLPYMGGKTPGAGAGAGQWCRWGVGVELTHCHPFSQKKPSGAVLMRHYLLTREHMRGISTFR